MVSLLIVSHSEKLAQGVKELAKEMAPDIIIASVGGTFEGNLGSDYKKIYDTLSEIYTPEGVIVLFDLGSSYMTTEVVKEDLELEGKNNIYIADAALVEGAVTAAVHIDLGNSAEEVINSLSELKLNKM